MPAPTIRQTARPAAPTGAAPQAAAPAIPFTRAARKRTLGFAFPASSLTGATQPLASVQVPPAGYLRYLELNFVGTTAGNAAAVAFANDGPFSLIQQISLSSANGDQLIQPIDGFTLYAINKYFGLSFGKWQPQLDPSWLATTGAGATGGSFNFTLFVPIERDSRDAFCALENMAANQAYSLNVILNPASSVYTTAPTTLPQITVTGTMHYWAAPAQTSSAGDLQQTAPNGLGSVALIQQQTPPIVAGSVQNIQLLNVGNTIRTLMFVLRNAAGARDSSQWPAQTNFIVNNDVWYQKYKTAWQAQLQKAYGFTAAPSTTAIGAANALDAGVFTLIDFINDGSVGDNIVDAAQNRDLWLVTGSATALNLDAHQWGATAGSLEVVQDTIRPSSPQALYAPFYK